MRVADAVTTPDARTRQQADGVVHGYGPAGPEAREQRIGGHHQLEGPGPGDMLGPSQSEPMLEAEEPPGCSRSASSKLSNTRSVASGADKQIGQVADGHDLVGQDGERLRFVSRPR